MEPRGIHFSVSNISISLLSTLFTKSLRDTPRRIAIAPR